MRCVICKQGETKPGKATVILERDGMTLVLRECRRTSVQTPQLLKAGIQVDIREYIAA